MSGESAKTPNVMNLFAKGVLSKCIEIDNTMIDGKNTKELLTRELKQAMEPFKDQMKDLKQNYKEQEWLDSKQQKTAMSILRQIDDDVDLAEFVDLFQAINKQVKKEE